MRCEGLSQDEHPGRGLFCAQKEGRSGMRVLRSMEDIEILSDARALPVACLSFLRGEILMLHGALGYGEGIAEFKLTADDGFMVFLERSDNLGDLEHLGIARGGGGLLDSCPEFVERVSLDGLTLYRVGILANNQCMLMLFLLEGDHDEEIGSWLLERARETDGRTESECSDDVPF